MIRTVWISTFLAALSGGELRSAEAGPIAAARVHPERSSTVEVLMVRGRTTTIEVESPVTETIPSPGGAYVGVMLFSGLVGEEGLPSFSLAIYGPRGRRVATIPRAQRFAFSPDDRRVAVIVGKPYEGAIGFVTESVAIVHLPSGRLDVAQGLEDARKLAWLKRDATGMSLFAEVNRDDVAIVRYDPRRRSVHPTQLMGLECSPDGKYYWLTPLESDRAGLCNPSQDGNGCIRAFTWKNKPIVLPEDRRIGRGHVWASPKGHKMVFVTRSGRAREAAIIDLGTGELRPIEGKVDATWTPRPGWLVFLDRGENRLHHLRD